MQMSVINLNLVHEVVDVKTRMTISVYVSVKTQ